jgi:hypothetical protein
VKLLELTDDEYAIVSAAVFAQIQENRKAGLPDRGEESDALFKIYYRKLEEIEARR